MVKIRECKSNGKIWKGHRLDSLIRRVWGKKAFFKEDHGLPGYGQIFEELPNTGSGWNATSLTGRVRVDLGN
jgi:hypothetical protein